MTRSAAAIPMRRPLLFWALRRAAIVVPLAAAGAPVECVASGVGVSEELAGVGRADALVPAAKVELDDGTELAESDERMRPELVSRWRRLRSARMSAACW